VSQETTNHGNNHAWTQVRWNDFKVGEEYFKQTPARLHLATKSPYYYLTN